MTADGATNLDDLATAFADKLTALTRGVLGEDTPRFAVAHAGQRLRVTPITDDERERRIPISINGTPHLSLLVRYYCCWDGSSKFLATDRADVHVYYERTADPLLRYEYVRRSKEPPGAHLQVHAHRDEMAYLLRLAERKGRPRSGLRSGKLPRLSEMHLPVGGHRMRPSLEDVLLFLEREFAIDVVDGWRNVIDEYLHEYRLLQLMSAVRDAPEAAAEVLRDLKYVVEAPKVVPPRAAPDDAKLFWP